MAAFSCTSWLQTNLSTSESHNLSASTSTNTSFAIPGPRKNPSRSLISYRLFLPAAVPSMIKQKHYIKIFGGGNGGGGGGNGDGGGGGGNGGGGGGGGWPEKSFLSLEDNSDENQSDESVSDNINRPLKDDASLSSNVPSDTRGGFLCSATSHWYEKQSFVSLLYAAKKISAQGVVPGIGGSSNQPASFQLGATAYFQQPNINGPDTSLSGCATTSNLLRPQDNYDVTMVKYKQPLRNSTFTATSFNNRKLLTQVDQGCPVPIYVDRAGIKANITQKVDNQTKFRYGTVLEERASRDPSNGERLLLDGRGVGNQLFYAEANLTRDNTKFVNGAIVGNKPTLQVDQGLGFCGRFPFFTRHQLKMTGFIQLKEVEEGAGKPPPPVLVLHGHYGGCVGDLPSVDAFTLGGPYSVRGYNVGEIGFATNVLEVAAEIRVPVRNTFIYAFAEHGNDLGSSKRNPNEGQGSSYGVGAKLGSLRAEYVVNHNPSSAALFFRFRDRF